MATKVELQERVEKLKSALDVPGKKKRIGELSRESQNPSFWQDSGRAGKLMSELSLLQEQVGEVEKVEKQIAENFELSEVDKELKKLEVLAFLSGPYDKEPAIISIHAGQGGVEAMDWAQMLERMYMRFAERRGWKVEMVDIVPGEEAGVKSATLFVDGPYAYGYLKHEAGAHRLVRQSPFNAARLRQTSFALVEVLPQLPETEQIGIKEDELEWQFFRASGHGGQNVQKVSTAVRLTHKPTGIVVTAQTERFQEQNRKIALRLLAAKLWVREQERKEKEKKALRGEYKPASWGAQRRSYVLHPYKMVKDLRTGVELSDAEGVLDGKLDEFVISSLTSV
ncbi:peptide chain release factor 2 [Candidatus Microgenomates bacterium]|nr:peptide chain release factor 2 [Candidatus Microgenomates bacterium]